jgi:diacylglycerol kinase family enzyme
VIVTNSDPWTYVGNRPLHPTPGVTLDTNLGIYARRRMSALGMLYSMVRLSGAKPRVGNRGAHVARDLETVTVRADEPMPVEVDGDYLEPREKLVFRSVPEALRVVV